MPDQRRPLPPAPTRTLVLRRRGGWCSTVTGSMGRAFSWRTAIISAPVSPLTRRKPVRVSNHEMTPRVLPPASPDRTPAHLPRILDQVAIKNAHSSTTSADQSDRSTLRVRRSEGVRLRALRNLRNDHKSIGLEEAAAHTRVLVLVLSRRRARTAPSALPERSPYRCRASEWVAVSTSAL